MTVFRGCEDLDPWASRTQLVLMGSITCFSSTEPTHTESWLQLGCGGTQLPTAVSHPHFIGSNKYTENTSAELSGVLMGFTPSVMNLVVLRLGRGRGERTESFLPRRNPRAVAACHLPRDGAVPSFRIMTRCLPSLLTSSVCII